MTSSYGKGASMFAKMGYVEGQGLGADGRGILNPIEQKIRAGRLGLGGMKEKTKQAVDEARRRGEQLESSEDEDKADAASRTKSRPKKEPTRRKPKVTYRTVEEIEASGLPVPELWKNIVDMTGPEAKVLSDMSDFKGIQVPSTDEAENARLAELARRDLEMYADEWQSLQARRKWIGMEEDRITTNIDSENQKIERLARIVEIVNSLHLMAQESESSGKDPLARLEDVCRKLEILQFQYPEEIEKLRLDDMAVAALHPILRQLIAPWDPLADHTYLQEYFMRCQTVLRIQLRNNITDGTDDTTSTDDIFMYPKRHSTAKNRATLFDSMMAEIWLPQVRRAMQNEWDMHEPSSLVLLFEDWQNVLPPFIQSQLLEQIVLPRLQSAVSDWNPRKRHSSQPHQWIFPWMPLLGDHLKTVIGDVRHKFSSVMRDWDVAKGGIDGLDAWSEVFGKDLDAMVMRHIYPKLVALLRAEFQVNPADQNLDALVAAFKWRGYFKSSKFSTLLEAEFFPKWWDVLFLWLTSEQPDFTEVNEWYKFWQDQFPRDVRDAPGVRSAFAKGLNLINQAVYLGPQAAAELKPIVEPAVKEPRKKSKSTRRDESEQRGSKPAFKVENAPQEVMPESTFKDVVEDYCMQNNLLFIPLRQAQETLGLPLYRITASASGRGGFLCYFDSEILWAKMRGAGEHQLEWEPLDFDEIEELAQLK
ncbi:GC-rich sequence DNA-binding factor-like protein-domain-containing protein [Lipomyces kononenkoae]|uniref:GC-rich sequence DNA-binding factor-like protein-domain-containing protein n=1 Tax=Lipomyces kononenkoae TaxID=34357 RepID=A0ACC3SQK4_LIPKO